MGLSTVFFSDNSSDKNISVADEVAQSVARLFKGITPQPKVPSIFPHVAKSNMSYGLIFNWGVTDAEREGHLYEEVRRKILDFEPRFDDIFEINIENEIHKNRQTIFITGQLIDSGSRKDIELEANIAVINSEIEVKKL